MTALTGNPIAVLLAMKGFLWIAVAVAVAAFVYMLWSTGGW